MNQLCRDLGIEYPIFAFSHCRDVVAAVSRAGGMGVLGVLAMSPEEIDRELAWIDEHAGGNPYGVDVVFPVTSVDRERGLGDSEEAVGRRLADLIPQEHREYAERIMRDHGVPAPSETERQRLRERLEGDYAAQGFTAAGGEAQTDAVFAHEPALLVSALGPPPPAIVDRAHERGALVGSLVGRPDQAVKSAASGIDLVVCQSYEAAAHTGEIGSMVLTPDVVDAVAPLPVLAAGGIGTGRQMAAAMSLGAQGVWTGSIWLTVDEAATDPRDRDRMFAMGSTDTVRSRAQTGKPNRQMRTAWTEAWDDPRGPGALDMPLQYLLYAECTERARRAGVDELVGTPVGQVVSRLDRVRPARQVLLDIVEEYVETVEGMAEQLRSLMASP